MFSEKFEYGKFIETIRDEFDDPEEHSVKIYKQVYNNPTLPPSWMIMEFITFGTGSKIFEHVTARQEKLDICRHFNLPDNVLMSWLNCFTHMRNRCAHHARFVYRSVKHEPILPSRRKHTFLKDVNEVDRSSLYASLCCMQHLISKINPDSSFEPDLLALVDLNPNINYFRMGFTRDWRHEYIWQ